MRIAEHVCACSKHCCAEQEDWWVKVDERMKRGSLKATHQQQAGEGVVGGAARQSKGSRLLQKVKYENNSIPAERRTNIQMMSNQICMNNLPQVPT